MSRKEPTSEEILQLCLAAMEDGSQSVDAILAQFPDQHQQVAPLLETARLLRQSAPAFNPRPAWLAASEKNLLAQIASAPPATRPAASIWNRLLLIFWPRLAAPVMVVACVLLLFGFSLNASSRALPGDFLYPLKIQAEQTRLFLSFDSAGDARLQIEFAQRRIAEIEALALESRYADIDAAVAALDTSVNEITRLLAVVAVDSPALALELGARFQADIARPASGLAILLDAAPVAGQTGLQHAMDVAAQAANEVEVILLSIPAPAPTPAQARTPTPTPSSTATALPSPSPFSSSTHTAAASPTPTASSLPATQQNPAIQTATQTPTAPAAVLSQTPTPAPALTNTPRITKTPRPVNTHKPPTHTPKPEKTEEPKPTKPPKP